MIHLIRKTSIVLVTVFLCSCLDMLNEKPQKVIGNIYLWNSGGGDSKYLMFKIDKNSYSYILNDPINSILSGDTILYLKSSFKNENSYHILKHNNGEKVIEVKKIDSIEYMRLIENKDLNKVYTF